MKSKRAYIIWRYGVVSALITFLAACIVGKMVKTTIIEREEWNNKADSLLNRVIFAIPTRGDILAADGTVLATSLTTYNIFMDYKTSKRNRDLFLEKMDSICERLAVEYPVRSFEEWKQHLMDPINRGLDKTAHPILREMNYADYENLLTYPYFREFKKKYSHGLYAIERQVRAMPYGEMARWSIGRCNYTRVPKFEGASRKSDSVDVLTGYSGLEYALNSKLYGTPGISRYVQVTRGVKEWVEEPAVDGLTIRTTIDIKMQDIVETELHRMLTDAQAEWGTCILMEVATGEIKAISNLERVDGEYIEARNYAVDAYEPGSVMKPISMLTALEDGYAFPLDREFEIGRVYAYAGGRPIRDTHSPARLPVSRFIEYSSNIGMTKLIAPHYENNLNGFRERLRQIGFLDTLGTGMHGERPPYIPTLDPRAGGRVSLSRMTFGYATMIPPLYTCAIYNAIANDGRFVRPRIVKEWIKRDGTVIPNELSYVRDRICSPQNARILRDMLYGVVYGDGGTAKTLRNNLVHVIGKTGTCIVNDNSGYLEGRYRLAFCGIFPYENPQYTCMVLICHPSNLAFNAPAVSSGTVVKNIALKMYARGMLGDSSDFREGSVGGSTEWTPPVLYASVDNSRAEQIRRFTGTPSANHFQNPASTQAGCVPDVRGMGLREAVAEIEGKGYTVRVNGTGYVLRQNPAPGTQAQEGTVMELFLTTGSGRN